MNLGEHAGFIIGSYAVAIVVVILLFAWVALDFHAQRRILADLEGRGLTRRSQRTEEGNP
jgi:heme exporter protein D